MFLFSEDQMRNETKVCFFVFCTLSCIVLIIFVDNVIVQIILFPFLLMSVAYAGYLLCCKSFGMDTIDLTPR
jgi:hypothetical protein